MRAATCLPMAERAQQRPIGGRTPRLFLSSFHYDRQRLTSTDAETRDAMAAAPCFQCIEKRREDARARRPERMAQRHRSAVHVHLLGIQPELTINCQRHRGESFVD